MPKRVRLILLALLAATLTVLASACDAPENTLAPECQRLRRDYEAILTAPASYACSSAFDCGATVGLCTAEGFVQGNGGVYNVETIGKLNAVRGQWRSSACDADACGGTFTDGTPIDGPDAGAGTGTGTGTDGGAGIIVCVTNMCARQAVR